MPTITPTGVGVAVGAVVFGALGWALGYVALTAVAAAAAVCVIAGGVSTFVVPKLAVERTIEPTRVERGSPALGLLAVRNPGRRRSRPCDAVESIVPQTASGGSEQVLVDPARDVIVAIPPLRAGRSVSVPYRLPTNRRGTLRVGPLAIERRDPLGLWHSHRPVGDAVTLLVQPHVIALHPRPSGRARHLDGPVSENAPRGTQTFHSLREYTPGDDIRRIHWRSTARTGMLMVQDHVDTSEPSTVVVLDLRAGHYDGERFEDAVDVAASIVAASQEKGFPVRLVTTAGTSLTVRTGQRGRGLADYLTTVEAIDGSAAGDLSRAAIEVLRGREHDAITVVTGNADAADLAATSAMTRRFSRPSLVTVRAADSESAPVRWVGGQHLDGPTAVAALARWHAPAQRGQALPIAGQAPGQLAGATA